MSTRAETTAPAAGPARPLRALRPVLFFVGRLLLILACLRQWGTADPWARLDVFAGSYLVCNAFFRLRGLVQARGRQPSEAVAREATGLTFDPGSAFWMRFFALGQLAVVLDYGQLHLLPVLENPVLQSVGLGLYLLAELGWVWVDAYLLRQLYGGFESRALITEGPYRRVRHPRYASLLLGRAGTSLLFASVLGWLFVLGWLALLLRRIPLEEEHLSRTFGDEYAAYARRTARLVPGLY